MASVMDRYRKFSRRRDRRARRSHQRLDIQGLRMVAVLTVLAFHLWGNPRGGFVGVDVFFVISGFLITGNLLRSAEKNGTASFREFYWNRIRRIVPAATVVLILTYLASVMVFMPFRAHQVGVDAFFAFIFFSNWRFALQQTDYFAGGNAVSPIQHYWSLSIEEQFYFVWPALIFLISLLVLRRAGTHAHRMRGAGIVMSAVVVFSLGWALFETATSPTWAYFNTFARVWELGVGALLATAVGVLARIPIRAKPWLSWAGLLLIAASLLLIGESSAGFPAPWAALPVAGAALVVAAGVGGEPRHMAFLRNPASTYIGDISYSLYLVHWPVIVILGALMDPGGVYFSVSALALSFGLAVGSYHFIENPLRRADWSKLTHLVWEVRHRRFEVRRSTQIAGFVAAALTLTAAATYVVRPPVHSANSAAAQEAASVAAAPRNVGPPPVGPLAEGLAHEIAAALQIREWPQLNPTMESVITGPEDSSDIALCGSPTFNDIDCTWGAADAPTRIVLVGDSVGLTYAGPLREIARNSNGQIQVHSEAMPGCTFVDDLIANADQRLVDACPARKQRAVDYINTNKPTVVIVANAYGEKPLQATGDDMQPEAWAASMRRIVDQFRGTTGKVVFLAAPPADANPAECYGKRGSTPADCISTVPQLWRRMASQEKQVATDLGGAWIDSRPWFCTNLKFCPSFVGETPTKHDAVHMSPPYGVKIAPVIDEALRTAGVY